MSFDPNQSQPPYQQQYTKKKSGAKWWLFGGLGCLVLLLLCGGGLGYFGYFAYNMVMNNPAYKSAVTTVENSEQVKAVLGEPVTVGAPTSMDSDQQGAGSVEISYAAPVSGPNGSGTMRCVVNMDQQQNWTTKSIEVEVDGDVIELESIENLELDIDTGN